MFGTLISFFGGKLGAGITGMLLVSLLLVSFLYGMEKLSHSNTKIKYANAISELSIVKSENELLKNDQLVKNRVISSLQNQNNKIQYNFQEYKKTSNKMLKLCQEAKEVPASKSGLEVLDEESNSKFIDAINTTLGVN
jgi:hypothetical protein